MNLLDLLSQDGHQLRRETPTSWCGPCPFCQDGDDRFVVKDEGGCKWRWWCRICTPKGDTPVGYLMKARGMAYKDVLALLGPKPSTPRPRVAPALRPTFTPKATAPPPDAWQEKAAALVGWASGQLWSPAGQQALEYLHGRGLTDDVIRAARLGFAPETLRRDRAAWGLPESLDAQGKPKSLYLPGPAIVIPVARHDGTLARIKFRRMAPGADPKYLPVAGGDPGHFLMAGQGPVAVLVESELDALLVVQETPCVAAYASGSAAQPPNQETFQALAEHEVVLVAFDSDMPGAKAAWQSDWIKTLPYTHRCPVPGAKDPTEAHQGGLDLAAWIETGLELTGANAQPTARRTLQEPRNQGDPTPTLAAQVFAHFRAKGFADAETSVLAAATLASLYKKQREAQDPLDLAREIFGPGVEVLPTEPVAPLAESPWQCWNCLSSSHFVNLGNQKICAVCHPPLDRERFTVQ